jgi:hypothetical protein
MTSKTIPVLTDVAETADVKRAFGQRAIAETVEVSAEDLSKNLDTFLSKFEPVLKNQDKSFGSFRVDELELSLVVSAEGGVSLIGIAKAGATAGLKVKLKRV